MCFQTIFGNTTSQNAIFTFGLHFTIPKTKKKHPQNPSPVIFTKPIKKQIFQVAKFHSILPFGDVTKFSEFSLQVQSKGSQGLLCQCPSKCQVASQILTSNFAHVKLASFNMATFQILFMECHLATLLTLSLAICYPCLWKVKVQSVDYQLPFFAYGMPTCTPLTLSLT
jgi:hypothetical protein